MLPVALIQEIGAYAGLIALPGLVILAVLHFSQARDVRRLREWAGRAPERAAAAQQQRVLVDDPRRAAAAAPAPVPTARPSSGAPPQPPPRPASSPATPAPTAPPPSGSPAAASPTRPAASPTAVSPPPERPASPPPATAATAVEPRPAAKPPPWARDEHFGLRGGSAAAPSRLDALRERISLRVAAAVGAVLVAIIVIVVLAAGGSSSTPVRATSTPAAAAPVAGRQQFTVAILNGTGVAGLGHKVGARVQRAGYRVGAVGDASGRQGSPSVVLYSPGNSHAAEQVARSLGVKQTAAADGGSELQARGAAVIVVVGSDLSQGGAP
jgi:hypothetical protein